MKSTHGIIPLTDASSHDLIAAKKGDKGNAPGEKEWRERDLAVATGEALIVPPIPHIDHYGLGNIARMGVDLVRTARVRKPTIESAKLAVSSLTQIDITVFTAILNPPQSGIPTVRKLE